MTNLSKYFLSVLILVVPAIAVADVPTFEITIKDHKFSPDIVEIPANQKVKLRIVNSDATPEEFESYDLNREKIITANSTGVVFVGPLKPGEYQFFGEFNPETAKGKLVVKEGN
jgi:plastocyanin